MGRKALYTKIYNQLRYQILSGELAIGSPLPPERKLAMQLGVSQHDRQGLCRAGGGRDHRQQDGQRTLCGGSYSRSRPREDRLALSHARHARPCSLSHG
ncbi:GntR family transcriptional regulator [Brevibacillus borstelensis]|uniref:GntR family transcriptional regulator n=1 Tax=Brevibacillus borstelensis TaxID=45462 RepID=UPI00203F05C2|nr:GntR family transcriptional regulator [Brevibacillus borstelensis]MCM3592096.1 GntR family transcriptional regulator [Brevibacillus borstelensis]